MRHQRCLLRHVFLLLAALVALSPLGNSAAASDIRFGALKANRILFFGNSITMSPGPVPGTNWTGGWGMAASTAEKDYVHLVTGSIAKDAGATPQVIATYNRSWELNFDLNTPEIQAQLAFKPDIVVVAVGENVAALNTPELQAQYATAFRNLLSTFKDNGNPDIFVRSCFWPDATKDNIMKQATLAAGDVFVDQSHLASPDNSVLWAVNEPGNPFQNAGGGVNAHPGDKGMKTIADSLYTAIRIKAVPEPRPLGMFMLTVPFVVGAMWRWQRTFWRTKQHMA